MIREFVFFVAILTAAWLVGLGASGVVFAVASRPTRCVGLPPSCHIGQEPVCLCESQWRHSCEWRCVTREGRPVQEP